MFRRLSNTLPPDPEFPADFEKLGYFITPNDQIRSITHPSREFHYFISKNPRVLDVHREAMNTAIRTHLKTRFAAAGLKPTYLSSSHPVEESTPHIPILTTPNLRTASRILLYFGESTQDLGILAYRTIGRATIASGSVLDFVQAAQDRQRTSLGGGGGAAIVIANPGQLLWYRRGARAVTRMSWDALPRKTGVDGRMKVDAKRNRVVGHEGPEEHLGSVMEFLGREMRNGARVEVAAVGDGVEVVVGFLDREWGVWGKRVVAVGVGLGSLWRVGEEIADEEFKRFWGKRARAYLLHHEPLGTPLYGRKEIGCNCYSSGESENVECILPQAYTSILDFFQLVNNLPGYEEQPILLERENGDDGARVVRWVDGRDSQMVEQLGQQLIQVSKIE